MPAPKNPFKAALAKDGPPLLGLWLSLASEGNAEALAGTSADGCAWTTSMRRWTLTCCAGC